MAIIAVIFNSSLVILFNAFLILLALVYFVRSLFWIIKGRTVYDQFGVQQEINSRESKPLEFWLTSIIHITFQLGIIYFCSGIIMDALKN